MIRRFIIPVILIILSYADSYSQGSQNKSFAVNSALADGLWYKIGTTSDGIYKLTYDQLLQSGVSGPMSSATFRLYGNGGAMLPMPNSEARYDDLVENPVLVFDGGDGMLDQSSDYILFYGQGTTLWKYDFFTDAFTHQINYYTDTAYYFFTFDKGNGKRIESALPVSQNPDIELYSYNERIFHEIDSVNLLKSGRLWYGEVFDTELSRDYYYFAPGILTSQPVIARFSGIARSSQKSSLTWKVNNFSVTDSVYPIDGNINSDFARTINTTINAQALSDTIHINITYYKPESSATAWLDYFELNFSRNLHFTGAIMSFRNISTLAHSVCRYHLSNASQDVRIWDITDFENITACNTSLSSDTLSFKALSAGIREYIAFDGSAFSEPVLYGVIPNQNLHALPLPDLIIITHPAFETLAAQLAEHHRTADDMNVVLATTQQVYNEFSSGKQDICAIRDFIRMFYERSQADSLNSPAYLMLAGDGSYDYKYRIPANTNFVPTYQTLNSLLPTSSYVSDDYFGLLDPSEGEYINGQLDIGIGRLPVSSVSEFEILLQKILRYSSGEDLLPESYLNGTVSNFDSWRNRICFIADDEDINLHIKQAEKLSNVVDSLCPAMNISKIYLDAYKQENTAYGYRYPAVNEDINKTIHEGSLIINYTGHGGELGWAEEGILPVNEIAQFKNYYNLPVFITATCEFSRYDNPALQSAGELLLLMPAGGSIALFSTTRVAYAHSNEIINRFLLTNIFKQEQKDDIRFGDAVKLAKNQCPPGIYMQNFTLLGDPALKFSFPSYKIITDSIRNFSGEIADTLKNADIITVFGHITDKDSNLATGFNGMLFPVIFDKPVLYKTLGNDPGQSSVTPFYLSDKILFKGNASILNGSFSFTFFVPKDISFGPDPGKISYYARSLNMDAGGLTDSICFFNDGNDQYDDISGPDIKIIMENENFESGGETSTNPMMTAYFHDTSGINAFGLGIGHNLTATLDDNFNDPFLLENLFLPATNNYSRGKASLQLNGLTYGEHSMTVSGWDLLNNYGEKQIKFVVKSPTDVTLGKIYNYPNPVSDHTYFYIEHNLSTGKLFVDIYIYNVSGSLVAQMSHSIVPGEFKPITLYWDVCGYGGSRIEKGFYIYKVRLSDQNGKLMERSDKLTVIK